MKIVIKNKYNGTKFYFNNKKELVDFANKFLEYKKDKHRVSMKDNIQTIMTFYLTDYIKVGEI